MPHSVGAETLANAVKGDPDVVEKDRLRDSPYLLYNWSLRGDPVSTPFVSRCWRPAFGQGKLSRAPNKISTTESPAAQALLNKGNSTLHPTCSRSTLAQANYQAAKHIEFASIHLPTCLDSSSKSVFTFPVPPN